MKYLAVIILVAGALFATYITVANDKSASLTTALTTIQTDLNNQISNINVNIDSTPNIHIGYEHFYRIESWSEYEQETNGETTQFISLKLETLSEIDQTQSLLLQDAFSDGAYSISTLEPYTDNNDYCKTNFPNAFTYQYVFKNHEVSEDPAIGDDIAYENFSDSYNIFHGRDEGNDSLLANLTQSISYDSTKTVIFKDIQAPIIPGYIHCFIPNISKNTTSYNSFLSNSTLTNAETYASNASLTDFEPDDVSAVTTNLQTNVNEACNIDSYNHLTDTNDTNYYQFLDLDTTYNSYDDCSRYLAAAKVEFEGDITEVYDLNTSISDTLVAMSTILSGYGLDTNNFDNSKDVFIGAYAAQSKSYSDYEAIINNFEEVFLPDFQGIIEGADAEECDIEFSYSDTTLNLTPFRSSALSEDPICRFFNTALDEIEDNTIAVAANTCDGVNGHRIQIVDLPFDGSSYDTTNVNIDINSKTFTVRASYNTENNFLFEIVFPTNTISNVSAGDGLSVTIIDNNKLEISSGSFIQNICISWTNSTSYSFPE